MAEQHRAADPLADVSQLLGGQFLSAKDVKDGDRTFEVAAVEMTTFKSKGENARAEKPKVTLTLAGDPQRKLALIDTNLQILMDAWGKDARQWIGKRFDAYFDRTVRDPGGHVTGGLRVRVVERDAAVLAAARIGAGPNGSGATPAAKLYEDEPPF